MQYQMIDQVKASRIVLGCMRILQLKESEAADFLALAVDSGINFFDHADVYGGGECEELFARAVARAGIPREKLIIQSKCGIRLYETLSGVRASMFDFSAEHIIEAAEGSLKRLHTDYLDFLLLHRPDTLMEPEEVGSAFDRLYRAGKVRHFGVSNFSPLQTELLAAGVSCPLSVNQVQFGLTFTGMVDSGFHVNMKDAASIVRDGGMLEYSRLKGITLQAWSPYQHPTEGVFIDNPRLPELNAALDLLAKQKHTTKNALASAWILRHPANFQVIAGTMNAGRLQEICAATEVELSREEWYSLYFAAGNRLP